MFEAIAQHPETSLAVLLLIVAVVAFARSDIMPGKAHNKIVAELKQIYIERLAEMKKEYEERLKDKDEECRVWREIGLEGLDTAKRFADAAKKVVGS